METREQARYASNAIVAAELLKMDGKRALDVGCGDGKFTRFLARSGAKTTGIDVATAPLERARAKAAEENLDIAFIEARAENMPFADGALNIVVFSNSLHHVDPAMMGKALAEAARVLAPGGDLYVMEPVAEGPYFEATRLVNDEREVRNLARAALTACEKQGFTPVREVVYQALSTWANFDEFAAQQAERGERRRRILAERGAEMRALFEGAARREGGRLAFDQIFRVNLLRRAT